jgi:putative ABC transport system permease protein
MENIGTQVKLPIRTAFQIALQGIKIRLGRALVTISGVVLGIAFLMSVFTGELISGTDGAMAKQKELQSTVRMIDSFVNNMLGSSEKKVIGIIAAGKLDEAEKVEINKLLRLKGDKKPHEIRAVGVQMTGLAPATLNTIGKDADLLIVMGDSPAVAMSYSELTSAMKAPSVLDTFKSTEAVRTYAGKSVDASDAYSPLYGEEQQQVLKENDLKKQQSKSRTAWIITISLLVTVIGITNSLLMSVTERFKEIGTMKCLGALSSFIRQLFLIESALIGFTGSLLGMFFGALLPMLLYSATYRDPATNALGQGFSIVFGGIDYLSLLGAGGICVVAGALLSIVAAIYPANFAARMVPAMALRSNV